MAHFAQLDDNNIVTQVIVVANEDILDDDGNEVEQLGIDVCKAVLDPNDRYVQTSYNGNFRKNYAGIGYTYDETRDAFIPPQPYASWVLVEETCLWDAPIAMPEDAATEDADGNIIMYTWDEDAHQADNATGWVQVEIPA